MEHSYRDYFEGIPWPVAVLDRSFQLVAANRRFRETYGNRTGGYCRQGWGLRETRCAQCPVEAAFLDGAYHESEHCYLLALQERSSVRVGAQPVRRETGTGEIVEVVVLTSPIEATDTEPARRARLDSSLGTIVHSLKGLVTGLEGGLYMVKSGCGPNTSGRTGTGIAMLERNLRGVRSTVENVLYYLKDREPVWEEVRLEDLASDLRTVVEKKVEGLEVGVSMTYASRGGSIEADPRMIRAVVSNIVDCLLEGCRQAGGGGAERRRIDLSLSEKDETGITIRIEGTGAQVSERATEARDGVRASWHGNGRQGPALFVSEKLVECHRGTLEIAAGPDKGTTVVVSLPKRQGKARDRAASS